MTFLTINKVKHYMREERTKINKETKEEISLDPLQNLQKPYYTITSLRDTY